MLYSSLSHSIANLKTFGENRKRHSCNSQRQHIKCTCMHLGSTEIVLHSRYRKWAQLLKLILKECISLNQREINLTEFLKNQREKKAKGSHIQQEERRNILIIQAVNHLILLVKCNYMKVLEFPSGLKWLNEATLTLFSVDSFTLFNHPQIYVHPCIHEFIHHPSWCISTLKHLHSAPSLINSSFSPSIHPSMSHRPTLSSSLLSANH